MSQSLLSRICVRPPYFALRNVELKSETAFANFTREFKPSFEAGPIAASEAGRHMAILGLCALASQHESDHRHYYLAHKARYQRLGDAHLEHTHFRQSAKGEWRSKREASAAIQLFAGDKAVVSLAVDYRVMPEPLFQRLFKSRYQPQIVQRIESPYSALPTLRNCKVSDDQVWATLGDVQQEWCHGHFENYPALPVAVVIGCLTELIAVYFKASAGTSLIRFVIEHGLVEAENLAFVGDQISLQGRMQSLNANEFLFEASGENQEQLSIGRIKVGGRFWQSAG